MKKILFRSLGLLALVILLLPFAAKVPPWRIGEAMTISAGIGAKLACSAYFISGFHPEQIASDVASYSPVNRLLSYRFDNENLLVESSFLGWRERTAFFEPGIGCTLNKRPPVSLPESSSSDDLSAFSSFQTLPAYKNEITRALDVRLQAALDSVLNNDNQKGLNTRAMIMLVDGKVLAESYAEGITAETPLLGWSMAKTLTAIMLARLAYLEEFNFDRQYLFDAWKSDARKEIRLTNLLTMTSGLDLNESYLPISEVTRMLFVRDSVSDQGLAKLLDKPLGDFFEYSSTTSNILQRWMWEYFARDNDALRRFLIEQVFLPIGLENMFLEVDGLGVPVGSSYAFGSALDWAKLGGVLINEGRIGGQPFISADVAKSFQKFNTSENDRRYGYHVWLNGGEEALRWPSLPATTFMMMGNRKQYVVMMPEKRVVFVRLGWTSGSYPIEENLLKLIDVLNARMN